MTTNEDRFAIVEIFGHRRRAGRVREVSCFGVTMLEIDVPKQDGTIEVERYGGASIFGMRFVTEEEARKAAEAMWPRAWETSPLLGAGTRPSDGEFDEPSIGDEPDIDHADEGEEPVPDGCDEGVPA